VSEWVRGLPVSVLFLHPPHLDRPTNHCHSLIHSQAVNELRDRKDRHTDKERERDRQTDSSGPQLPGNCPSPETLSLISQSVSRSVSSTVSQFHSQSVSSTVSQFHSQSVCLCVCLCVCCCVLNRSFMRSFISHFIAFLLSFVVKTSSPGHPLTH